MTDATRLRVMADAPAHLLTDETRTALLAGAAALEAQAQQGETVQRLREALRGLYELAGETVEGARRLGTARALIEQRLQQARAALTTPPTP